MTVAIDQSCRPSDDRATSKPAHFPLPNDSCCASFVGATLLLQARSGISRVECCRAAQCCGSGPGHVPSKLREICEHSSRQNVSKGASLLAALIFSGCCCFAFAQASRVPDIFKPASTPAESIHRLSLFVLIITALIFVVVFSLLVYAVGKFRHRAPEDGREPPQVYGSNQIDRESATR